MRRPVVVDERERPTNSELKRLRQEELDARKRDEEQGILILFPRENRPEDAPLHRDEDR